MWTINILLLPILIQKKKKFDLVVLVWHLQYFCSSTMGIATDILALAWGIFNIVSKKIINAQEAGVDAWFDRTINQSFWQIGFLRFMLKMVISKQEQVII